MMILPVTSQISICFYEKIIGIMSAKMSIPKALIRHPSGLDWRDGIWHQVGDFCFTPPVWAGQMCLWVDTWLVGAAAHPSTFSKLLFSLSLSTVFTSVKKKKKKNQTERCLSSHSAFISTLLTHRCSSSKAPTRLVTSIQPFSNRRRKKKHRLKSSSSKTKEVSGLCHFTEPLACHHGCFHNLLTLNRFPPR